MRTFAQKQNRLQKRVSSSLSRPNKATLRPPHREQPLLHLQRTIGNQAVLRLLQTKAEELKTELTGIASSRFGHNFRQTSVPSIVHEVLRSPGQPLDAATRNLMEPRFGHDFSQVRVHTDLSAARSAEAVAAQAYTVGDDVVFGAGRYAPASHAGQRLLAHELTHVVQQRGAGATPSIQRFHLPHGTHTDDETKWIAPGYLDMLKTLREIIDESTVESLLGDFVNMNAFIQKAGGYSIWDKISEKLDVDSLSEKKELKLKYRYLFTCRCGLIDMRHFLQLLYVAHEAANSLVRDPNRTATRKGREHELNVKGGAASESRFGPEDTTSNALGAFTARSLPGRPGPERLWDAITDTLALCVPVYSGLSAASLNTVKHFYGDLVPDPKNPAQLIPKNQNETAVPFVLAINECDGGGGDRSFPFGLDTDDDDRKTISGVDFEEGSKDVESGSDIRDFISTQRPEVLKALPTSEKIRMLKVLLGGKVSDDDLNAASRLNSMMTPAEKAIWQQHLPLKK